MVPIKKNKDKNKCYHTHSLFFQAWIEPFLQRKVEEISDKIGKKTAQLIGSLFDTSDLQQDEVQKQDFTMLSAYICLGTIIA